MQVVMVGAGVMGCLGALELLASGCKVTILERQTAGRESSWAGGGIVSPLAIATRFERGPLVCP